MSHTGHGHAQPPGVPRRNELQDHHTQRDEDAHSEQVRENKGRRSLRLRCICSSLAQAHLRRDIQDDTESLAP